MSRANQTTIDFLTAYFAVMEAKEYERLGDYYDDDITLTFANAPTVTGKDVVLARMTAIGDKVESLAHPLFNVWQEEDGVAVFEVTSVWRFLDGVEAAMPARSLSLPRGSLRTSESTSTTAPSTPTSAEPRRSRRDERSRRDVGRESQR